MNAVFEIALIELDKREGMFSNDVNDPGGPTKYGITQDVARKHGYNGDMQFFPRDFAVKIYKQDYWNSLNLGLLVNQKIANEIFDMGVNQGVLIAGKIAQRAANILNRNQMSWLDLKLDGLIGPRTRDVINSLSAADIIRYHKWIFIFRGCRYAEIQEKNPRLEIYNRSWLDRQTIS